MSPVNSAQSRVGAADGSKEAKLIVVGEKGRAQLGRFERDSILSTIADTNKVKITFAQAWPGSPLAPINSASLCQETPCYLRQRGD